MDEDEDEYIDIEDIRLNEDDDDVSSKLADGWYDEDSSQWSILSEAETEFESEWKDDALWDEISNIETSAGRKVTRKCMNIFGRKLCLCEFLNWIKYGSTKHRCGKRKMMMKHQQKKNKQKMQRKRWNKKKKMEQKKKVEQMKKNQKKKMIQKKKEIEKK